MKNVKFLLFPTYIPVTLIMPKLQIHAVNPTNPDILKFTTKFLKIKWSYKFKISPSFTRSLNVKKATQKCVELWNLLGSSYKKLLIKNSNMPFIHFMSLKLIKTTQKCLIFWNLLGVVINKVLTKKSKFILYSLYFLGIFRNHPTFAIFEFIR